MTIDKQIEYFKKYHYSLCDYLEFAARYERVAIEQEVKRIKKYYRMLIKEKYGAYQNTIFADKKKINKFIK